MISGCDNSTGTDMEANIPDSGMEANIDGDSWSSKGSNGFQYENDVDGQTVIEYDALGAKNPETGTGQDNEILEVEIYSKKGASDISEKTYDVSHSGYPRAIIGFLIKEGDSQTSYIATDGEVTVHNVTEDGFSGTFNGNLINTEDESDSKEVTDGGFNVDFTYQ
jgi:hypothetical protein